MKRISTYRLKTVYLKTCLNYNCSNGNWGSKLKFDRNKRLIMKTVFVVSCISIKKFTRCGLNLFRGLKKQITGEAPWSCGECRGLFIWPRQMWVQIPASPKKLDGKRWTTWWRNYNKNNKDRQLWQVTPKKSLRKKQITLMTRKVELCSSVQQLSKFSKVVF